MTLKDCHCLAVEPMNLESRTYPNQYTRENQMSCQKTVAGKGSPEFFFLKAQKRGRSSKL